MSAILTTPSCSTPPGTLPRLIAGFAACLILPLAARAGADWAPEWVNPHPLPPPSGEIIRVATADALLAAGDRIGPGATLLLAPGEYRLPRPLVLEGKTNIVLRGENGNAGEVTLRGQGWDRGGEDDDLSDFFALKKKVLGARSRRPKVDETLYFL